MSKLLVFVALVGVSAVLLACRSSSPSPEVVVIEKIDPTPVATSPIRGNGACGDGNILSQIPEERKKEVKGIIFETAEVCLIRYPGPGYPFAHVPDTTDITEARRGRELLEQEILVLAPAEMCDIVWSIPTSLREYRFELSAKMTGC